MTDDGWMMDRQIDRKERMQQPLVPVDRFCSNPRSMDLESEPKASGCQWSHPASLLVAIWMTDMEDPAGD